MRRVGGGEEGEGCKQQQRSSRPEEKQRQNEVDGQRQQERQSISAAQRWRKRFLRDSLLEIKKKKAQKLDETEVKTKTERCFFYSHALMLQPGRAGREGVIRSHYCLL